MADKQRRARDLIKRRTSVYLDAVNDQYSKYLEGSPTYVVYYQLISTASLQDKTLENVHSLIGNNSPKKYRKIYDVPVYGIDLLDPQNDLSERGLLTSANGEMIILPNTLIPHSNDFFTFDYEGYESHLFRINDVQFDKLTAKKYYKVAYNLYPNNADDIFNNVLEEYSCENSANDTIGGEEKIKIVPVKEAASNDNLKTLADDLINKYTSLFYSEENDMFVCKENGTSYWSPYLQHFLHETNALRIYSDDFMKEFYFLDINDYENPEIFDDLVYRDSIFRNIETKDNNLNFASNFLIFSTYNLKLTRNLPFFMSTDKYVLLSPVPNGEFNYLEAFPLLFRKYTPLFKDVDHYHKVHIMDNLHLQRLEPYIKDKDIVYECNRHELEPTAIYFAIEKEDATGKYKELEDASISALMKDDSALKPYVDLFYFEIIRDYLNDTLVIDEALVETLNKHYYTRSIEDYIFMPLILFIIKKNII